MIKYFFNSLSYIFHPIFLPTLGIYFLFTLPAASTGLIDTSLYGVDPLMKAGIYRIFITLLIVAPGLSILIMIWSKLVKSLKMETKTERSYAIAIMLIYAVFCYTYLRVMIMDNINYNYILIYLFSVTLTIFISFILNFYTKISLHAIGIFGIIGALIGYFNNQVNYNIYFILFLILIAGLVCAGRIFLKAHKPSEVLLGMLLGFGIQFLCMKFEWFI